MNPVIDHLPLDNAMCSVRVIPTLAERTTPYRFVRCSDGEHFWDNLKDEVLQFSEVTHWTPAAQRTG
jgi:hypothetical protein